MIRELSGPLDLEATLDGGQAFRWRREEEGWVGVLGRNVVRLRLASGEAASTGSGPALWLDVASAPEPPAVVAPQVASYLGLDTEHAAVRAALAGDPCLAEALAMAPGLRLLRQDPWECLASFILSAHCHIPRIQRNVEALCRAAGSPVPAWGRVFYAFPAPEAVARMGEERLRALGLGFRAPGLAETARRVAEGAVDLEALRHRPYGEARVALMGLPGVGPKIADCVLAFSLGHGEAFPVDRWVARALRRDCLGGENGTPERAAAWGRARFGPRAAYAAQLLFHRERWRALAERPLPGSRAMRALGPR